MKIVFLDISTLGGMDVGIFNELGEVVVYQTTLASQTLKRVKDADIVLSNKVVIDRRIIDNSNIKMIQILATGMNNVDLEYAKTKNIVVKNVAGYSTNSVAQLTFAMVLNILNRVEYFDRYSKNSYSQSSIFTHIINFNELNGKIWGIIGLGTIGKKVAKIAKAFGCEVVYYSTSGKNFNTEYKKVTLQEVLKSDIISIHSPLNNDTKNLLNKTNLYQIKKGAVLINMGRGGIVNEYDLAQIIDKRGFYAGFDVITKEPISKDNPLLKVKNIILTPHIAWASVEARMKLLKLAYKNVRGYIYEKAD